MPSVRFSFHAGSGGVLWAMTPEDRDEWGYPVDLRRLPVGEPTKPRTSIVT
ncbi:hypothetical protein [Streptomyces sp. Ru73]|uniref:hypothetical protein n=1 Tax=Streptomyces sp. Ru73 TaxID=2080748 RepID=UPI0015E3ED7C|nr:hypothetical protein [Streptomyces sp. Ru73]